jgi:S-adenosyl methyltransferase
MRSPIVRSRLNLGIHPGGFQHAPTDLREPDQVLSNPQVRDLTDFGQPVGIIFICMLHCL